MSRDYPSNNDDIIDSRQILERIDDLEGEREYLVSALEQCQEAAAEAKSELEAPGVRASCDEDVVEAQRDLAEWDESEEAAELKMLKEFADEAGSYSEDWKYGATLIRDSYFRQYAMDFADDIGAINKDASWPNDCIDWERAARELQMDYTAIDFNGVDYWVR